VSDVERSSPQAPRPNLTIVSTTSRLGHGGLAAYTAQLARLAASRYEVYNVARFLRDGARALDPSAHDQPATTIDATGTVRVIGPARGQAAALRVTRPAIHRPALQGLAIKSFELGYGRSLRAALPSSFEAMHVVGSGWELLGFPAAAAGRRAGVPVTVLPAIHPGQWGDSRLDGRLYRSATTVFALSRDEAGRLMELGVSPERVVVCPLGPSAGQAGDGERFRREHALGDRPLVLFVGRKQRYKGFHALCEAMSSVGRSVGGAMLVAAGAAGEPLDVAPPELLDLGLCSDEAKADALAACDVYCMPSVGESFGIAYVDAWTYGKPVITGPAPASRELVEDSGGGLSVDQDAEAIAEVLTTLLSDAPLRRDLGERGREHQRRHWTWERTWELHARAWGG
jgi:glycosyltransferase involved in cell wall biosynthesis